MKAIDKLTQYFLSQVGYLEKASNANLEDFKANPGDKNYTKYGEYFGHNGPDAYWCDYFVDYCLCQVFGKDKANLLLGGMSGYTPTSSGYFKSMGRWHTTSPQAGDIIFFRGSDRINHTGYVYKVSGQTVYTVEGNTSNSAGVECNGGCVAKKEYAVANAKIAGYGRPDYSLAEDEDKQSGWVQEPDGWRYYLGDTGECIRDDWHEDADGKWYWFDAAGIMVVNTWYRYNGDWYYLGSDGAMVKGLQTIDGKWYRMGDDGKMSTEPVILTPDDDGALQYTGLVK